MVTVEYPSVGPEGDPITEKATVPVSRSYSYWEVTSLEVYGIKEAVVNNGALPGGKVSLTPSGPYKKPAVDSESPPTMCPRAAPASPLTVPSNPQDILAAAYNAVPSPTVRMMALPLTEGGSQRFDNLLSCVGSVHIPTSPGVYR
jgi:hypothetical protein